MLRVCASAKAADVRLRDLQQVFFFVREEPDSQLTTRPSLHRALPGLNRLGTEHEKLAVLVGSRERAPHAKIAHILQGLVDRHGWEAMTEHGNIIGAKVPLCS